MVPGKVSLKVPSFLMTRQRIRDHIPEKFKIPTPSLATYLMPRDIVSSEPRHWMVFGQLVMPVECCAEAPPPPCLSTALHGHDQLAKYHPCLGSTKIMSLGIIVFSFRGLDSETHFLETCNWVCKCSINAIYQGIRFEMGPLVRHELKTKACESHMAQDHF